MFFYLTIRLKIYSRVFKFKNDYLYIIYAALKNAEQSLQRKLIKNIYISLIMMTLNKTAIFSLSIDF